MTQRWSTWVLLVAGVMCGCGGSELETGADAALSDVAAVFGDASGSADPDSSTGRQPVPQSDAVDTNPLPDASVELLRDPSCDPADRAGDGAKVPWEGFRYEGTRYTCNTCRDGLADLQGTWRLVDFDSEDPEVVLTDEWQQTFTFDGNTWRQEARWSTGGVAQEASMAGWYWCSSKPEVGNETKVFIVTELTPNDAFGYEPGYVFTTDLLNSTEGGDKLAFWFYEGFNTGEQVAEIYCRVGDDVTTLSGEVKPCLAPWAR